MRKKIIVAFIILLIAFVSVVSAASDNDVKGDSDYEIITVEKLWVGDNDTVRPDSVNIEVLRDNNVVGEFRLTKAMNWNDNTRLVLPIHDDNGDKIEYTLRESGASDYEFKFKKNSDLNYTLTNTYIKKTDNTTQSSNTTDSNTTNSNSASDSSTPEDVKDTAKNMKKTKDKTNTTNSTLEKHKAGNPIGLIGLCFVLIIAVVIRKDK